MLIYRRAAGALAAGLVLAAYVGIGAGARAAQEQVIYLHPAEGAPVAVGTLALLGAEDGPEYRIDWDETKFSDHFLSMRPFKCLKGPEKLWCRVPYPYENRRVISEGDLTDLEYDLLFIWKGAGDYGINMWNGIYYRLHRAGTGAVGTLHEVDMDILAAPPDPGDLRPIGPGDLEEGDPDSHWLPRLTIE